MEITAGLAKLKTQINKLEKRIHGLDMEKVSPKELHPLIESLNALKERYKEMKDEHTKKKESKEKAKAEIPVEAAPSEGDCPRCGTNINPGKEMCDTCKTQVKQLDIDVPPVKEADSETPHGLDPKDENVPCQQCKRTDLPLHTDYKCPDCSAVPDRTADVSKFPTLPERKMPKHHVVDRAEKWPEPSTTKMRFPRRPEHKWKPKIVDVPAPQEKKSDVTVFSIHDVVEPSRGTPGSKGRVMGHDEANDMVYVAWNEGKLKDSHGYGAYSSTDLKKHASVKQAVSEGIIVPTSIGQVELMDETHLRINPRGDGRTSQWTSPMHFEQVHKDVIKELESLGYISGGRFFNLKKKEESPTGSNEYDPSEAANDILRDPEGFEDYIEGSRGVPGSVFTAETAPAVLEQIKSGVKAPYINGQVSTLGGKENASILLTISADPKESWANGILENSNYAKIHIENDGTIEAFSGSLRMRKANAKTVEDIINKLNSLATPKTASLKKQAISVEFVEDEGKKQDSLESLKQFLNSKFTTQEQMEQQFESLCTEWAMKNNFFMKQREDGSILFTEKKLGQDFEPRTMTSPVASKKALFLKKTAGGGAGVQFETDDISEGAFIYNMETGKIAWRNTPVINSFHFVGYYNGMREIDGRLVKLTDIGAGWWERGQANHKTDLLGMIKMWMEEQPAQWEGVTGDVEFYVHIKDLQAMIGAGYSRNRMKPGDTFDACGEGYLGAEGVGDYEIGMCATIQTQEEFDHFEQDIFDSYPPEKDEEGNEFSDYDMWNDMQQDPYRAPRKSSQETAIPKQADDEDGEWTEEIDGPMDGEPTEDDIFIQDVGHLGAGTAAFQGGDQIAKLDNNSDNPWDEFYNAIASWMEKNGFFPTVWSVSDHGNHHLAESFYEYTNNKHLENEKPALDTVSAHEGYEQHGVEELAMSFINGNISYVRKQLARRPKLKLEISQWMTEYAPKEKESFDRLMGIPKNDPEDMYYEGSLKTASKCKDTSGSEHAGPIVKYHGGGEPEYYCDKHVPMERKKKAEYNPKLEKERHETHERGNHADPAEHCKECEFRFGLGKAKKASGEEWECPKCGDVLETHMEIRIHDKSCDGKVHLAEVSIENSHSSPKKRQQNLQLPVIDYAIFIGRPGRVFFDNEEDTRVRIVEQRSSGGSLIVPEHGKGSSWVSGNDVQRIPKEQYDAKETKTVAVKAAGEKMPLNVFDGGYYAIETSGSNPEAPHGYAIFDPKGTQVMVITTKAPVSQERLESIVHDEYGKRELVRATLNTDHNDIKIGTKLLVSGINRVKKEIRVVVGKSHVWVPLSKVAVTVDLEQQINDMKTKMTNTQERLQQAVTTEAALPPKPTAPLQPGMKYFWNKETNTWEIMADKAMV